jgi:hypothetical protein
MESESFVRNKVNEINRPVYSYHPRRDLEHDLVSLQWINNRGQDS